MFGQVGDKMDDEDVCKEVLGIELSSLKNGSAEVSPFFLIVELAKRIYHLEAVVTKLGGKI